MSVAAKQVAGGVIGVAIITSLLSEIFSVARMNMDGSPFSSILTQVGIIGSASLMLLSLGGFVFVGSLLVSMIRGGSFNR